MKYMKILGLLVAVAAALMAFAASASAQITVNGALGVGYRGTSTNASFHGPAGITCKHSEIEGTSVNAAGTADQAGGTTVQLTKLTFTECNHAITVTAKGHLFISSNGAVTATGARITVQTTILGFPVHCIMAPKNTSIGNLTEGVNPPVIHIGTSTIPHETTSGACGANNGWTGTYIVMAPVLPIVVD